MLAAQSEEFLPLCCGPECGVAVRALIKDIEEPETVLPEQRFTTLVKRKTEQWDYWREISAPIAEARPATNDNDGFSATLIGHDFRKLHIATMDYDAMQYRRTSQHVQRMELDHWQLVLRKTGSEISCSGNRVLQSHAGSLDLRSYVRPISANASAGSVICIWLARDNFPELSTSLDAASHRAISGTMKPVLQEFILSLERHRATLTLEDIPSVASSFSALLAASLRQTQDTLEDASLPISAGLLELARKHIDENLASPELGSDSLCKALKISRRKLYYLFQNSGGVCKFIRNRRLAACHNALEKITDRRMISTIAYDYGFTDTAHFSRMFRTRYGYSPRDAREIGNSGKMPNRSKPTTFMQWLLQVDG